MYALSNTPLYEIVRDYYVAECLILKLNYYTSIFPIFSSPI